MLNPITRALTVIRMDISEELVMEVFGKPKSPYMRAPVNVDEEIASRVIRPRVLVDCDIIGGTTTEIRVAECKVERTADLLTVITVPKTLTQGKTITSVHSLSLIDTTLGAGARTASTFTACSSNDSSVQALAVHNSYAPIPRLHTGQLEIIGENTIIVHDAAMITMFGTLRVNLANDENLNNLPFRFFLRFQELAFLAVKSYIYTKLRMKVDQAKIYGGFELGAFREELDSFSNARQEYIEYLETKWTKVAALSDRKSYHDAIRMTIRKNA